MEQHVLLYQTKSGNKKKKKTTVARKLGFGNC